MAAKKRIKFFKKLIHVFHTILEFLLKFKKATGKSSIKGKSMAKLSAKSSKSLLNPVHVITKSFASVGVSVSSSTASVILVGAVIVAGSAVDYESNPDEFSKQLSDPLLKPINALITENQGKLDDLIKPALNSLLNGLNSSKGSPPSTNSTNNPQIGLGVVNSNQQKTPETTQEVVSNNKEPDSTKTPSESESKVASGEPVNNVYDTYVTTSPIEFEIPEN
ncbi:MAG: hypothetical protein ACXVHY_09765 [Methanobacterium sp.]